MQVFFLIFIYLEACSIFHLDLSNPGMSMADFEHTRVSAEALLKKIMKSKYYFLRQEKNDVLTLLLTAASCPWNSFYTHTPSPLFQPPPGSENRVEPQIARESFTF
jgi:hypothetical protein